MGEDSRAYTVALLAVIKTTSKQRKNNPLRKQTGIDREFSGLCEVCSVKLAIKCFPFAEQVCCWRCVPLPSPQSSPASGRGGECLLRDLCNKAGDDPCASARR